MLAYLVIYYLKTTHSDKVYLLQCKDNSPSEKKASFLVYKTDLTRFHTNYCEVISTKLNIPSRSGERDSEHWDSSGNLLGSGTDSLEDSEGQHSLFIVGFQVSLGSDNVSLL